jgi:hypothetical protein
MTLWLNGKQLATHAVAGPLDHPPDFAEGSLQAGRNIVLLKISQFNRAGDSKSVPIANARSKKARSNCENGQAFRTADPCSNRQ